MKKRAEPQSPETAQGAVPVPHPRRAPDSDYLILDGLRKVYSGKKRTTVHAVNEVSISVARGEFVTLLGPSGCGKTTTLRMIAGFLRPTAGRIVLNGVDVTAVPAYLRNCPMVFQDYALFPHLTVFENIAYGLRARKANRQQIEHDVAVASQMVNLIGLEGRYPRQLSGGQQQRVALARALVLKPEIILFDEPLSNLDAKLRVQTRTEIKRVQKLLGITALYVTHDQTEALSLSDRIVIMNRGRVVQIGTPKEIYHHPSTPFVSDFIGNANFLDGEVEAVRDGVVSIHLGPTSVMLPAAQCDEGLRPGDEVVVSVKPEAIEVGIPDEVCATNPQMIGRVDYAGFVGASTEYRILFGDTFVTALQPNVPGRSLTHAIGDDVGLHFQIQAIRAYRV
ncbi:MAG: ABC transporter ATP-binding protein [Spirochaetaceae bacterium]|nr:MAG: ABC transporter ATP-binding protein [Spirochaetaceae bacterium]